MKVFVRWLNRWLRLSACCVLLTPLALMSADNDSAPTPVIRADVMGVYFPPTDNAARAIVQVVDTSEREVLVAAYGFTHNAIAQALIRAHQRGVAVRVVVDARSASSNQYVMNALRQEAVQIRQDAKHAIAHNKVMVIDESVVITGSFNFTNSAASRNAENLIVLKSEDLAMRYKADWLKHWAHSAHVPQ